MREPFMAAFNEWERRYRADPHSFMSDVEQLLGCTPKDLAEARAVYFEKVLNDLSGGQPWNTITLRDEGAK